MYENSSIDVAKLVAIKMIANIKTYLTDKWNYWSYLYNRYWQSVQFVTYSPIPLSIEMAEQLRLLPKKYLVLDLDETLIHSTCNSLQLPPVKEGIPYDFQITIQLEDEELQTFQIYKRPHLDLFLNMVSQWYEVVIYTASLEVYAGAVLNQLDRAGKVFGKRFYRQHCRYSQLLLTKDLQIICTDLRKVFIIDNSPIAYAFFPHNAIPIKTWICDQTDTELLKLLPFLDALRFARDVRSVLGRCTHNNLKSSS